MMRRTTHIFGGLFFGLIGYIILVTIRLNELPSIGYLTGLSDTFMLFKISLLVSFAVLGASLPDKLDPPFSSKHRRFAHSKILLLFLIVITLFTLYLLSTEENLGLWSLYYFLLGYISHLFLDSLTPAGLF